MPDEADEEDAATQRPAEPVDPLQQLVFLPPAVLSQQSRSSRAPSPTFDDSDDDSDGSGDAQADEEPAQAPSPTAAQTAAGEESESGADVAAAAEAPEAHSDEMLRGTVSTADEESALSPLAPADSGIHIIATVDKVD